MNHPRSTKETCAELALSLYAKGLSTRMVEEVMKTCFGEKMSSSKVFSLAISRPSLSVFSLSTPKTNETQFSEHYQSPVHQKKALDTLLFICSAAWEASSAKWCTL
ncbi:hypothetical protein COW46_05330 [Candidatus Gracilibacteria bacterium CG17_big_fil_post_rev_8_21_14_2_50_48_13]|nr:MAG: hypothetical protein COW46_05330 [Candidatus Gracilibacteria bacterium CG17_big_fil_post_rev_8_21_14_2_50_48_13]